MSTELPSANGSERILFLSGSDRDDDLLSNRVSDRYEIVYGEPSGEWDPFDLCVVDASTYRRVKDQIGDRKRATTAFLPVLLLVPERSRAREADWLAEELEGSVDDLLVVPASRAEFDTRVEALLRSHRQSKTLALFRRAIDEANIGILLTDPAEPDNPIIYANEGFLQLAGYERENIIGRNCRFLQGSETDEAAVRQMREAVDAEEPTTVELLNYRANGEPFWNRVRIMPITIGDDVTYFLGFQEDITEQVERAQELEQYETIVQTSKEPVFIVDHEDRFTLVNESMIQFTRYSQEELLGCHISQINQESYVRQAMELLEEIRSGTRDQGTFEAELRASDGTPRQFANSIAAIRDEGQLRGTVFVAHDVTELRMHQRRLSVLDRVLRHNLRNKMNVIIGHAESITDDTNPANTDRANKIVKTGSELLELSDSARQFERIIEGGPTETDVIDIAKIVRNVVTENQLDFPDVTILTDVPDEAKVHGTETLEVALDELIQNAIKHNDNSEPTVEVSVEVRGSKVELTIADNGPGLTERDRGALMRGMESPLEHTQGLGIWLVLWTVESIGGSIKFADRYSQGTRITIQLSRIDV